VTVETTRRFTPPDTFFTTDHYRGYPTVLVRLDSVTEDDLRDVLEVAWLLSAPKRLRAAFERGPER
jgi:hypothetical protein